MSDQNKLLIAIYAIFCAAYIYIQHRQETARTAALLENARLMSLPWWRKFLGLS